MTVTDEYLQNNAAYAEQFTGPLPLPPSRHVAILACMDARLDVYRVLGIKEGESHVIRNAGGVVTDDEIRSLAISQRLLGTTEIILIHHTDCGMLTFTDDDFKRSIQDEIGIKPNWAAESFPDIDEDVRQSLKRIENSPFVTATTSLRGFVFDVATGKLNEVLPIEPVGCVPVTDRASDLALALRIADEADAITRARFGALDLRVDDKPDLTPVSDADLAVERAVRATLGEHRPADSVLGKNSAATRSSRAGSGWSTPSTGPRTSSATCRCGPR